MIHNHQTVRDMDPTLAETKSITPKIYQRVGDLHRGGKCRNVLLHKDGKCRNVLLHKDGKCRNVLLHKEGKCRNVLLLKEGKV
jgi:hypothetical protein